MAGLVDPNALQNAVVAKGYKTTEFWVTLASQGIGLLVLSGVIDPKDAQVFNDFFANLIKLLVDIAALAYMLYTSYGYINGRNDLKRALIEQQKVTPIENLPQIQMS